MAKAVWVDEKKDIAKFMCPGCQEYHTFSCNGRKWPSTGASWNFDGNLLSPTITPSLNISWGKQADPNWKEPDGDDAGPNWSGRCHSIVTNGYISFCGDCTHSLAGQTVELPEIE